MIEDAVNLQSNLNLIFRWAKDNNMLNNEEKFQLTRNGGIEEKINNSSYNTESNHTIAQEAHGKDLGVIMYV